MGSGSGYSSIILLVVMILVFYVFLLLPENRKKKKLNEMRNSLRVGDANARVEAEQAKNGRSGGLFGGKKKDE